MAEIKDKIVTVESLSALHEHNKETYVTKTNIIPVENGGTGSSSPSVARDNLGITPENIGAQPAFNILPISNGGTGQDDGAKGLENLFASGFTIVSPFQYGDTLPEAGVAGRIFFKRVVEEQ